MTALELKERRVSLGLTRAQLAATLDLTYRCVHLWESGKRRVPTIAVLALDGIEARKERSSYEPRSYEHSSVVETAEDATFHATVERHWIPDEDV